MAITSYKAVVGYYNSAGTPNITTAVTGQLSDGWIPIGAPILTDAYGQCTQMMAKTDATPVIATSAYTVVTAANPQPPDATWDAQGEPLWIDTATYLQAYTKGGSYAYPVVPVSRGGTGAITAPLARTNLGLGTAATYNIGTSGGTIPLLNTANTWSEAQTFNVPLAAASGGTGNANGTAAALTTPRTIQTNLSSTSAASFDGTANVTPGVTGVLQLAQGGTGVTRREDLWPIVRPADVFGNAGRLVGLPNGVTRNHIWLWNQADTPDAGYANFIEGGWFDSAWRLGGVRSSNIQLSHAQLTVDGDPGPAADFKFYPNGTAQATNWSSTSDPRVKSLVEVIPDPLDLMRSIRGYSWYYEHTGSKGFGFLSSEVKVNFSGAVNTFGDTELPDGTIVHDVEGVDVSGVSAALHHEAILALMDKVEALESRLALLESGK